MASWSGVRKQVKMKPSSYDTTLVSSFRLHVNISLVSTVDSSTAWFAYHSAPYLRLATVTGEIQKSLNVNFQIDHIFLNNEGELLMTEYNGSSIKKLTKSGVVMSVADTKPLQSRGICVSGLGEILVCLSSRGLFFPGLVRKLSPNGELIKEYRCKPGTQNTIFRVPFRVKQSVTGDICVLDTSVVGHSRALIVLENSGHVKFTYPPEGDHMQARFIPMNVETDIYGNILVSDPTYGIHLLDEDGVFIQFILSKADGLEFSRGLSMDPSDKLWVCSFGNDRVLVLKYNEENDEPVVVEVGKV